MTVGRRVAAETGRGIVLGGATGALLAAADLLRAGAGLGDAIPDALRPWTVGWYTLAGALAGALLGCHFGAYAAPAEGEPDRRRWLAPTLGVGATAFFVVVLANHAWLPAFTSPVSLAVDVVVFVLAFLVLRRIGRNAAPARPRTVQAATVICLAPLLWIAFALPSGDDDHALPAPRELSDRHPNVLLVVVDTLRADHTSLHGYARPTTPELVEFAEDAVVFTNARSVAPWTVPSVATLVTGLPPLVHTADTTANRLPTEAVTLSDALRAAGYRTGLFSDNPLVSTGYGFDQGFDHVDDRLPPFGMARFQNASHYGIERIGLSRGSLLGLVGVELIEKRTTWLDEADLPEREAGPLTDRFLAWLDGVPAGERWFGYVHYMDPHAPYTPPPEFEKRFCRTDRRLQPPTLGAAGVAPFQKGVALPEEDRLALIDQYDGEIASWDAAFGRLIDDLRSRGALDDTVILVTSDHGEAFYEHALWVHHNGLFEELIHVPFVLRVPGVEPGTCDAAVSQEGVLQTLLRAAGYVPPVGHVPPGKPLIPVPAEDRVTHHRVFGTDYEAMALVENGEKWIFARSGDLEHVSGFRLGDDPGERVNLAETDPERAAAVRRRLLDHDAAQRRNALRATEAELAPSTESLLEGLGYVK